MTTGDDLRAARLRMRVGLRQLARQTGRDKGHLSRVERGDRDVTPALVLAYERALGTTVAATASPDASPPRLVALGLAGGEKDRQGGSAARRETVSPGSIASTRSQDNPDNVTVNVVSADSERRSVDILDRLERALQQPRFTDGALIGYLRDVLASQRRLEDVLGARNLIRANFEQVATVETLAKDAPRAVRRDLLHLAAEWAQFLGWMHRDVSDPDGAERWYDRTTEWAHRSGNIDMIASVLSMKSHLAWSARDAGRAIDLAEASFDIGGTSAAVRALSAQQLARGYALAGDNENTERCMDRTEILTRDATDNLAAQPPWVYFHSPERLAMQRAIAYTELGRGAEAVDLLLNGIKRLDGSLKRDHGWHVARLAVAHAISGEVQEATTAVVSAAKFVVETGSSQTLSDIRRARATLYENWPNHPAVRHMDQALRAIAA